jgi:four helix bundle protein
LRREVISDKGTAIRRKEMEEKINSYRDLIVWQKAVLLVTEIYSISKKFPVEERFGLTSQMNRAAVSIPSNIAEGWGRELSKSYLQFLRISRGSVMELQTLLIVSKNLKFIPEVDFDSCWNKTEEVGKMLHGLITSIHKKISLTESI